MRLLYTASFAILLIDILKKEPIKSAVILCNGKVSPYVSKDDGYYVFYNLPPGKYNLSILTDEYMREEIKTSIEYGESKKIIIFLSIKSTSSNILNSPRIEFLILKNKEIVKNSEINIKLNSSSTPIKLVQKANKGDEELVLNIPENNSFILQNYLYSSKNIAGEESEENNEKDSKNKKNDDSKEKGKKDKDKSKDDKKAEKNSKENQKLEEINKELLFLGYDRQYKSYVLSKPLDADIVPLGGNFYPFWNLRTDLKGKVMLPFVNKLMGSEILEFEITLGDIKKTVKSKLKNFDLNRKILNIKVNFNDKKDGVAKKR